MPHWVLGVGVELRLCAILGSGGALTVVREAASGGLSFNASTTAEASVSAIIPYAFLLSPVSLLDNPVSI